MGREAEFMDILLHKLIELRGEAAEGGVLQRFMRLWYLTEPLSLKVNN